MRGRGGGRGRIGGRVGGGHAGRGSGLKDRDILQHTVNLSFGKFV